MNAVAMMTPLPKNLKKSKMRGWAKTDLALRKRIGAIVPAVEVDGVVSTCSAGMNILRIANSESIK